MKFKLTNQDIIKEVNKYGMKANPKYICVNPRAGFDSAGVSLVEIICLKTKEKAVTRKHNLKRGQNPFYYQCNDEVIILVNSIGKKHKHPFLCVNPMAGYKIRPKSKQKHRLIEIQSLISNKKVLVELSNIKRGKNPFNDSLNRFEVIKVQPKYERLLKKFKIPYTKEFKMGKKSIDFMFEVKGKRYGLEVKQSEKWHSGKNQLETYKKLANLKPFKLEKIILSDPKGSHSTKGSLSLKQFERLLKSEL